MPFSSVPYTAVWSCNRALPIPFSLDLLIACEARPVGALEGYRRSGCDTSGCTFLSIPAPLRATPIVTGTGACDFSRDQHQQAGEQPPKTSGSQVEDKGGPSQILALWREHITFPQHHWEGRPVSCILPQPP